ncbi:MAG: hypothetical protein JHC87_09830, partial [Thermoleophilaceae bacterium]|nr:hypothetical protein [Thermoleophilaceae bacterium]
VTPQGEAILVRPMLGERCNEDGGNLGDSDNGRILAVSPSGLQRQLATRVNLVGPALVRGNFLLYRKGIRTRVANLTAGTFADYWNGVFGHIDLSEGGSLLIGAPRASTSFDDFFPGLLVPGKPPKKPESEPSHPLLMFANGQPTTPTVVDPPSKNRVPIGTFCGGGYVKVVGTLPPPHWFDFSYESEEDDDIIYASTDGTMHTPLEGPAGVELRTASGEFVRTLGVIRKGTISAPICIGDRVVVPFRTGGGFLGVGQKFKFYPFDVSQ